MLVCVSLLAFSSALFATPEWARDVPFPKHGPFPNPRQVVGSYSFGWGAFVAATAQIRFAPHGDQLEIGGTGRTIGLVRTLWPFDVRHRAVADAATLLPINMEQVEKRRHKTVTTNLKFTPAEVIQTRKDSSHQEPPKTKTFEFPGLLDLHSALLYVRSQRLHEGDVYRLVVYPATNAYLATLKVIGRESITVPAGTYNAIKFDLELKKVSKNMELEPHKKFKQATLWISDDPERLLLRIEARVFVGTVFCELESAEFPQ